MIGSEVWECKVVELAQGEYVTNRASNGSQIVGFCLVVEFHWGRSATNETTPSVLSSQSMDFFLQDLSLRVLPQ